jgi:hypothetical protein
MAVIVVTRLRLKDPALLDEFFTAAVASLEQAKKSDGSLGADVLADANNTWWTVTARQERRPMRAFVDTEPHRSTMARCRPQSWRNHDRRAVASIGPGS